MDDYRVVIEFNDALNAHDVDGMMRHMTADCIFENTSPFPDGTRIVGQASVLAFWEEFFRGSTGAHIDIEEIFGAGDRCIMRWTYRWIDLNGTPGHVRGIDVYKLE